jgi:hypothetical protein
MAVPVVLGLVLSTFNLFRTMKTGGAPPVPSRPAFVATLPPR